MRKIALLLVLMFYLASTASAVDFVKINDGSTSIVYVDRDSIQARDGYLVAWVKWVPMGSSAQELKEIFEEEISYYLNFSAYHMNYAQYQDLATTYYDKTGASVRTFTKPFDPNNYEEATLGSIGGLIYDFVMFTYRLRIQPEPPLP